MAFLIDTIDSSGLFAQSANSATIATKDSNGNDITATYQPSGDYYSASNPSGFMTELPVSATDVIDTVTANSGSWGGSALPISAGPGIKVNLVDNTLVFSNDETVLWSGTAFSPAGSTNPMQASATMSESIQNFDQIRLDFRGDNYYFNESVFLTNPYNTTGNKVCFINVKKEQSDNSVYIGTKYIWIDDTTLSGKCGYGNTQVVDSMSGGYYGYGSVVRVVGINRISGGN